MDCVKKYFLQLKLANIGAVPVTSVKVCVEAFDSEGNPAYSEQTPGIASDYNGTVPVGEAFGTKQLLPGFTSKQDGSVSIG